MTFTVPGTPVRRTDPSSVPDEPVQVVHTGIIEVLDAESDELLGYVARELSYGVEFAYDPSISNALHITFQTDGTGDGTQLDISTLVGSVVPSILDASHLPTLRTRFRTGPFLVLSRAATTLTQTCHLGPTSKPSRFVSCVLWVDVFSSFS